MPYKNGDDLVSFSEFNKMMEGGQDLSDEYHAHAELLEKQISRVDQMIAAMHDMSVKIDN